MAGKDSAACRAGCTRELCGDTIVDAGEQCDDGNTPPGDCCSATCQAENGQPCDDGDLCTTGEVCVNAHCTATPVKPWINEFDYDDFRFGGNQDSDEFIEIAGPAGTDTRARPALDNAGAGALGPPLGRGATCED
jgi:cysteine-rich repeat protein